MNYVYNYYTQTETTVGREHYKITRGVCPSAVCLSVCRVPRPHSRTERLRKPKIGSIKAHHVDNSRNY